MKKLLTAIFMLLACNVMAQYSIRAKVMDGKTREVLSGATLKIADKIYVADQFGMAEAGGLATGEYGVEVKFLGYATQVLTVNLIKDETLEVFLEETYRLTDEVVVYATRANEKTPTTFTNVNKQTLQKQNFGQDMPFILNWTPSVVTTSDAGTGIGYTGIRIRGSDATRINVTINGIPYNDSESQGTFWVNIPDIVSSTQSVQVQRGVGTSTNGAGSFGGSVNLQTLSQQVDPYAELMVGGGSFNTQRYTVKAGTGLLNDHWSFDGRVSKIKSDGYIDRASSDLSSYYLSGSFQAKKTIVKAIVFGGHEITYQSWNGNDAFTMKTNRTFNSAGALYDDSWNVIGYYDNEVDDYKQDHYQLHVSQQLNENWNANVSLHYTYGRGFFEQYKQSMSFADMGLDDIVIENTTISSGDFVVRRWLDNKFYGTTFSFNYEKGKTLLTLGGAYNQYGNAQHFGEIIWAQYASNSKPGQLYYNGESEKNDFNVYAKWNYEISSKLNVFADLQYRTVDYKTAGVDNDQSAYAFSDQFNFVNPKVGISYSVSPKDVLYSSYAIANREPNRTDYLDGATKPKSERLGNLEAGWRRNTEHYSFEANYYWMQYTDQLVLTGELDDVGNPIRANVGESFRTGVELSGMWKISEKLSWLANMTWSLNKNKNYVINDGVTTNVKDTDIILSPNVIVGSQLSWNAFKGFQVAWLSKYVGDQYLDNTQSNTLTLSDYFINDLRLNYAFNLKSVQQLEVSFLVNNLFDVAYSSNGYSYDGVAYYYPQAGTNFLAMLTMKF
jgi:iron complex outermembrane receptor protein